jgi:hypothetical protein
MTSPFDGMKTENMTVYGVVSETYGVKAYGIKGVALCSYVQGGKTQTDSDGVEFVPESTFYPSSLMSFDVVRGDLVAVGDTSAETNPDNVPTETVRKVSSASNPFGWGNEKWFYTG